MLSDEMRHQIALAFIAGYPFGVFELGTYYTNGDRLVYLPNDEFDEYEELLDANGNGISFSELSEQNYVDIQNLIPEGYNYVPDYTGIIYGYRTEFMQAHNLELEDFEQNFNNNDVLEWIVQNYPEKIERNHQVAIELIKSTLLNIDKVGKL